MSLKDIWKNTMGHYNDGRYEVVTNDEENYSYIHVSGGILMEQEDTLNHISLKGYKPKIVEVTEETINHMAEEYPICNDKEWIQALGSQAKHELFQRLGEPVTDQSKVNEILSKLKEK
jgi:hypothetical protein